MLRGLKMVGYIVLAALAAAAIVIAVVGRERVLELAFGPPDTSAVDFATLRKTKKPNQYLVCPPGLCAETPDRESPEFDVPAEELRGRWEALMTRQPRLRLIGGDPSAMQFTYVQRTDLMRFPDVITVRFIPLSEARSTLAVYSRSQIGYSDWGVNEKRVTAWLEALKT